jgi:phosphopentomutase
MARREPRAIVLVLDSVGVGELPDAASYGDEGSNTLGNTAVAAGGLRMPNLGRMGLGNITPILGVPPTAAPSASWGKNAEESTGKDTTTGHWEMMGLQLHSAFPTYLGGFPPEVLEAFTRETGLGWLGNYAASGTVIIQELGDEHVATGKPIIYTSADSVFQIAAHEDVIPIERLYEICEIARTRVLVGEHAVGRIIARPFIGPDASGTYNRTHRRRDFALEPSEPTVLDRLAEAGILSYGIGKIGEIFAWRGICESPHSTDNMNGVDHLVELGGLRHGVGASQRRRGLRSRTRGGRRPDARPSRRDDRRRPAHHHRRPRMRSDYAVNGPQPGVHAADRAHQEPRAGR